MEITKSTEKKKTPIRKRKRRGKSTKKKVGILGVDKIMLTLGAECDSTPPVVSIRSIER